MKLTYRYGQYKRAGGHIMESELHITVNYDHKNDEVETVYSVVAYNNEKNIYTDLTAIFCENLTDHLDAIIEEIDWRQEYRETVIEQTEMIDE